MNFEKNKTTIILTTILALTILAVAFIYNFKERAYKIKLGLDLRSGSHLTLKLIPAQDPVTKKIRKIDYNVINQTIGILEKRINPQGTKEVIIQPEGADRIIVEVPEETDIKKVEERVSKIAHLEFKEQYYDPAKKAMLWRTVMDGTYLKEALPEYDGGRPIVSFTLTKDGAKEFAKITERNLEKPIAIFFDNKEISAPVVRSIITGGRGQISGGNMEIEECNDLANYLNAGSLPVPIEILESMTISPTLGQESLNKSLIAGFIGLILVLIFMIWYYKLPGIVADIALIIYTIMLLATISIGGFVLTLPGIAGLILSIGMAVDANILIFERIKEELKNEKTLRTSVDLGFKRAFSSILDSHATTFLGALVIYWLGASSIKGFGMTLMCGTIWSLITAVFCTKIIMDFIVQNNISTSKKLYD